jgi:spermidine synthase
MFATLLRKIRYNFLFYYYRYKNSPQILFDGVSRYSRIRVIQEGSMRRLVFVKPAAEKQLEYTESILDLIEPLYLRMEYTRLMFAGLFFPPELASIKRVLMIGLGGGVFCPVIRKYLPQATLDIVEIDQLVVDVARRYFEFSESPQINLYINDARKYIEETNQSYDLILSDACILREVPLHLRTVEYYHKLKDILNDRGVFSGNISVKDRLFTREIKAITSLFPATHFFVGKTANAAVVACNSTENKYNKNDVLKTAQRLEQQHRFRFPLTDLAHCFAETLPEKTGEILTDKNISTTGDFDPSVG